MWPNSVSCRAYGGPPQEGCREPVGAGVAWPHPSGRESAGVSLPVGSAVHGWQQRTQPLPQSPACFRRISCGACDNTNPGRLAAGPESRGCLIARWMRRVGRAGGGGGARDYTRSAAQPRRPRGCGHQQNRTWVAAPSAVMTGVAMRVAGEARGGRRCGLGSVQRVRRGRGGRIPGRSGGGGGWCW